MDCLVIIPARYASTRFPGKPLKMLAGKPVIEHVYERAVRAVGAGRVLVATDDERIRRAVEDFGGTAVMTSEQCANGTERCREAYLKCGRTAAVVVNVQGDEPLVDPTQIRALAEATAQQGVDIATLVRRPEADEDVADPSLPKVVTDLEDNALYFSRMPIPCHRDGDRSGHLVHVGMYGFRSGVLCQVALLPPSPLEQAEKLEQLRWLQNGRRIRTVMTAVRTVGIDTPQDLARAEQLLARGKA